MEIGLLSSNPQVLNGETVVFTGTLASMTHREAMDAVAEHGGRSVQTITSQTTLLVVGEEGWALEDDGRASQKLEHALRLAADGHPVKIVAESDWLQMLGLEERRDDIRRACTPAMLSRLLNVPVRLIRRWERQGLIRPVRRVCRLPYFDYREVAGARRLAALLEEGVSPKTLESSLQKLSQSLGASERSLAQLNLLVRDDRILVRDDRGVLLPRTGQRLLDFESVERPRIAPASDSAADRCAADSDSAATADGKDAVPCLLPFSATVQAATKTPDNRSETATAERRMIDWNADEWFQEGCRLTEESEFDAAINAFRNSLSLLGTEQAALLKGQPPLRDPTNHYPDPADVNLHLADALYRHGRTEAALERYHSALESAPDFIEAWTLLGCLQAELNDLHAAETSFSTALAIHPANPDALLHCAQLLDRLDRPRDAAACWRQYLQHERRGPWSDHARDRIAALERLSANDQPPTASQLQLSSSDDDWDT
ncbi:MAG: MerR family transcriptional regulator [Planctomycetaceae bacterium]